MKIPVRFIECLSERPSTEFNSPMVQESSLMKILRIIVALILVLPWTGSVWGNDDPQTPSAGTSNPKPPDDPTTDDPTTDDSEGAPDARLAEMLRQAGIYELKTDENPPRTLSLYPKPLMRFNNPVGGVPDGIVVMWMDGARPAVLAQVFQTSEQVWVHEMQSMAASPLVMHDRRSQRVPWQPREKGLKWHLLDDAEAPASSKVVRRVQMREISGTFSASDDFKRHAADVTTSRYQLRLLPRPLYRYPDNPGDVIDGAVFAFVHGTDPEVFVALEAIEQDGKRSWRYALAPMTCWAVQVQRKGVEVWSVPERLGKSSRDVDYHVWVHK